MTAYLQPGDRITIAFGIDPTKNLMEQQEETSASVKFFTDLYASAGIKVVASTASTRLTHPMVISVVRPNPMGPLPARWKVPWQDPE